MAGGTPILAHDMYEYSHHIDYGAKAAGYVDVFMAAINRPAVHGPMTGYRNDTRAIIVVRRDERPE